MPYRPVAVPASRLAVSVAALALLTVLHARAEDGRVPYVPTPQEVVERMLQVAKVGPRDFVIDLGSGDGRIVITAAKKYGARGFGVDLDSERIHESNRNARRAGVTDRVSFLQQDLFDTDLGQATVITMYLLPQINIDLRPKLLNLKPGTRIASHDFDMGDWKPDAHEVIDAEEKWGGSGGHSEVFLWVVPARVAGAWHWELQVARKPFPYQLRLEQKYQVISGSASVGGRAVRLQDVRLRGAEIRFRFTTELDGSLVSHVFTGRVAGDAIHGSVQLSGARVQGRHEWNARRVARSQGS